MVVSFCFWKSNLLICFNSKNQWENWCYLKDQLSFEKLNSKFQRVVGFKLWEESIYKEFITIFCWLQIYLFFILFCFLVDGYYHVFTIYHCYCEGQLWRKIYIVSFFPIVISFLRYPFISLFFWKIKMTFTSNENLSLNLWLQGLSIIILWHIVSLST